MSVCLSGSAADARNIFQRDKIVINHVYLSFIYVYCCLLTSFLIKIEKAKPIEFLIGFKKLQRRNLIDI